MLEDLGDDPIYLRLFLSNDPRYEKTVRRTTWEDLIRNEYLSLVVATEEARTYRLTPKGWLLCLELTGASKSNEFKERLGRIIAAMKRRVKGRTAPAIVSPWELANESQEPFGMVFNVIDSRASSSLNSGRIGATWYKNQRGQLVEIPVDFNMEPIDIAAGLNVKHLQMIEDLEERLQNAEEDRHNFTARNAIRQSFRVALRISLRLTVSSCTNITHAGGTLSMALKRYLVLMALGGPIWTNSSSEPKITAHFGLATRFQGRNGPVGFHFCRCRGRPKKRRKLRRAEPRLLKREAIHFGDPGRHRTENPGAEPT